MRAHLTQPEMILIQPEVLKAKQLTQLVITINSFEEKREFLKIKMHMTDRRSTRTSQQLQSAVAICYRSQNKRIVSNKWFDSWKSDFIFRNWNLWN